MANSRKFIKLSIATLFMLTAAICSAYAENNLSSQEMLYNGDFSQGNTGFYSDYLHTFSYLNFEGYYSILKDPSDAYPVFSSCRDHTSGDGYMMVVNSSETSGLVVWGQRISGIKHNQYYEFSFWSTTVIPDNPSIIQAVVNGDTIPPYRVQLDWRMCNWAKYTFEWYSENHDEADVQIISLRTEFNGNDFALDDLSFKLICPLDVSAGTDTTICAGDVIRIGFPAENGFPPYKYEWSPPAGLSSTNSAQPILSINNSSTYYLKVSDQAGCSVFDTISVNVTALPPAKITTDKRTTICPCESVVLSAPTGYVYEWSTGETTESIEVSRAGKYSVKIFSSNECYVEPDTVITVINSATAIGLDSISANIGETVSLPLKITTPINKNICPLGRYHLVLSFNSSILTPAEDTPIGTISNNIQTIEISGDNFDNILEEIEFITTLGDTLCSDISIDVFEWDCNLVNVTTINGKLCLDDVCKEPSYRFFTESQPFFLLRNYPNPAVTTTTVDFNLNEKGATELFLINSLGEKIKTVVQNFSDPGFYSVDIDVSDLHSGVYFYVLKTPSRIETRKMEVIK